MKLSKVTFSALSQRASEDVLLVATAGWRLQNVAFVELVEMRICLTLVGKCIRYQKPSMLPKVMYPTFN